MNSQTLIPLLDHPASSVRDLTQSVLSGEDCLFALQDALEENGEPTMFEVGESIFIKTPTIYYLGCVKRCTYMFVELEHVSEISETGNNATAWENGTVTGFENYPSKIKAKIPIGSIIAAIEWDKPLLNK